MQGAFQQLHKGLLHRVFVTAVEHGVLQNVENAGAVTGDGAKCNGKGHIFVCPLEPAELCTAFFMGHFPKGTLHLRDLPPAQQGKMVLLDNLLNHWCDLLSVLPFCKKALYGTTIPYSGVNCKNPPFYHNPGFDKKPNTFPPCA